MVLLEMLLAEARRSGRLAALLADAEDRVKKASEAVEALGKEVYDARQRGDR